MNLDQSMRRVAYAIGTGLFVTGLLRPATPLGLWLTVVGMVLIFFGAWSTDE